MRKYNRNVDISSFAKGSSFFVIREKLSVQIKFHFIYRYYTFTFTVFYFSLFLNDKLIPLNMYECFMNVKYL